MSGGFSLVTVIPDILQGIERFLLRRRSGKAARTAAQRRAVRSVLDAVIETERYVYERRRGGRRAGKQEARLARLWSRAALDVQMVDRRLSRIALMTSFTWANPELLSQPEYESVPGQLGLIRNQCEWLLEHWS